MRRILLLLSMLAGLSAEAQNVAVGTNLADYASLGTLNVSADYGVARHWTIVANARYNPFSFENSEALEVRARQRAGAVGVRFWPWHIYSGWWMAGKIQYQEYSRTGIRSTSSEEGDRAGGSLSAGYSYMISPHWNLNIGVGVWSGYDRYTVYECARCGRKVDSGTKTFLLPNDILMSFSYVF